jgi:sulfite oxidase
MTNQRDLDRLHRSKPGLTLVPDEALNAETPLALLREEITPNSAFFVRNNGQTPDFSADELARWTLTLDGAVARPRSWTLADLASAFETHTVTAVLECAGNGRAGFSPATDGLAWGPGAVGCARWTGVRLRDLLAAAGPAAEAVYTGHHSPDRTSAGKVAISRGLPLDRAGHPDVLVCFAMNGEPLPHLHGGPLRIVAPGFPGSAWQKWLTRIEIRDREHDGPKMTGTDYRMPRRPYAPGETVDPADFEVITDIPAKAMIVEPLDGFAATVGETVEVTGFAWSGRHPVASVHVSGDGGGTWSEAALESGEGPHAWRRFRADVVVGAPALIMARAMDTAGGTQPLEPPWNPRGYGNNAVQKVMVQAIDAS